MVIHALDIGGSERVTFEQSCLDRVSIVKKSWGWEKAWSIQKTLRNQFPGAK